ncbi:siroheme synthase CysG [Pseudoprimorskyibacter insulae]|uniref:Siroheme synthase n=1 Tax=Pseudoprimorskyibacter insulae TaxID=1695997 RepID=A0A2R8AVA2_9RHOB|nr:siroheme synthase CysG [Pseudoprimorskyibacter insulae]SPF79857.1 Siroheme synthase [Pseudoprimorskyibacter insulae]
MKQFPLFVKTTGRTVLILGGGEEAAQRARLFGRTDATVLVSAKTLDWELEALREAGQITLVAVPDFASADVVFVTRDADLDAAQAASKAGRMVHVSGRPDLSDFALPTLVDRDPVVVAIATEGTAPSLARQIKADVETMLDPALGRFAALAGTLRRAADQALDAPARNRLWRWAFSDAPWQMFRKGQEREALKLLKSAVQDGQGAAKGHISLVGAGPGAKDLLTMRAVNRLQAADVIFYDRLVDPEVLDYARPDARRVYVGKVVGACAWPQDRICEVITAEARKGLNVVRLKSGDPGIFGRATEELEAARAEGIETEIVPGVTAAMGAAAAAGRSLTERGVSDTLVFATGMVRPGDAAPDWARHAHPGTAMAFYMSVGNAPQIVDSLRAAGMPADAPVSVGVEVSKPGQHLFDTVLADLPQALRDHAVSGCATILATWPKDMAQACTVVPLARA